jgi:hypothetical protein
MLVSYQWAHSWRMQPAQHGGAYRAQAAEAAALQCDGTNGAVGQVSALLLAIRRQFAALD